MADDNSKDTSVEDRREKTTLDRKHDNHFAIYSPKVEMRKVEKRPKANEQENCEYDSSEKLFEKTSENQTLRQAEESKAETEENNISSVQTRNSNEIAGPEVSPVRASTTSFSVLDILDPKKFTGHSPRKFDVRLRPWLQLKHRLTNGLVESTEDLGLYFKTLP